MDEEHAKIVAEKYNEYVSELEEMLVAEETPKVRDNPKFLSALEDNDEEDAE